MTANIEESCRGEIDAPSSYEHASYLGMVAQLSGNDRFAFAAAGELVANLQPIAWLVRGYLEADSLALMYGEPGHGKSFVAIDLAASVATGTVWHGHSVRQGAVFIIAGEGRNGIARRLRAWELARNVSLAHAPLFVSYTAASLSEPQSASSVNAAIEELAKSTGQVPALVVVDTVSRNLGSADENSSADMAAFVRSLDAMRHRWRASVLMVHHSGKDASRGARGSTVLKGAVDAEYRVVKDDAGMVCIEATKMKDAELPGTQGFKLKGVKLPLVDDDGGDVWGAALEAVAGYKPVVKGRAGRGKNQVKALDILRTLYEDRCDQQANSEGDPVGTRVLLEDWRVAVVNEGFVRQRFKEVKDSLVTAGLVRLMGPYVEFVE